MKFKLDWKGGVVKAEAIEAIKAGLTEFGLRHETASKAPLKPHAGVLTGTYRRSLHAASPKYQFAADDVKPGPNTPERGGTGGGAEVAGDQVQIVVGSGLRYAVDVEKRYGTIAAAHRTLLPQLPTIIETHARKGGLLK